MSNDKDFTIYAIALIAGISTVLAIAISAGIGAMPSAATLVEHVGLGLLVRASYKSFAGPGWMFGDTPVGAVSDVREAATSFSPTANAMS